MDAGKIQIRYMRNNVVTLSNYPMWVTITLLLIKGVPNACVSKRVKLIRNNSIAAMGTNGVGTYLLC